MRSPDGAAARPRRLAGLAVLVILGVSDRPACAWTRMRYADADVVARSELILVARLEPGSIRKEDIRENRDGITVAAYMHHATLIVTEVLKGTLGARRIPVIIHYGLYPKVHGNARPAGGAWDVHEPPDGAIVIGDTAMHSFHPLRVRDAREDNLWFLRRRSGYFGREPGHGDYGIVDPEDVQPIALKDYFLAYLSADPEAAVRRAMGRNPEVVQRGQRFLDRQEVRRIVTLKDPRERVERLLPYYRKGLGSGYFFEARNAIAACGRVAGPALWPVFREPGYSFLKVDVIALWGEIGYRDCVPELIALLEEHDTFWAAQDLKPGWWNREPLEAVTLRRRDVWGQDLSAVRALGRIGDPRARPALEAVLRRWRPIPFESRSIVEASEQALKSL